LCVAVYEGQVTLCSRTPPDVERIDFRSHIDNRKSLITIGIAGRFEILVYCIFYECPVCRWQLVE